MRITIVYDNEAFKEGLVADWGFSCLVEAHGRSILFDTGADGSILLDNMGKLNIEPSRIEEVFISHSHLDHTGGLPHILALNPVRVYVPSSCPKPHGAREVVEVKEPLKIDENIFSTGELENIEQSLVVRTERGLVVVVGCSHPRVGAILQAASRFGKPWALIGGLHGFRDFGLLDELGLVCPTHCTQFKSEIKARYPEKYVRGGAGKVIDI